MKVLSGVYPKDAGTVRVFGEIVENLTPKRAQDMGISIIHQELNLCRHLSVAENIFLGIGLGVMGGVGTVVGGTLKNALGGMNRRKCP